jgi:uncharacterized repeat protein (TIGR01451 family)
LLLLCAILGLAGLTFALTPLQSVAAARQALAARWKASPAAEKILSLAPESLRRVVKKGAGAAGSVKAPEAARANLAMGANMMVAAVTKEAVPPTGSAVATGQTIVYTITVTNDGSPKGTIVNGFLRVTDTAPTGTLFQNASVLTQPGGASTAWSCSISGGVTLTCRAGDDTGAGVENFDFNQKLQIRVEAVVQNNVSNGTTLNNTATFSWFNGVATSETDNSNQTSHTVAPAADLSLAKFVNAGGGNSGGNVIAGGGSAPFTTAGVVSPAPGAGNIDYQLLIGNGGPGNGSSVLVQDTIPNNTVLVSSPALDPSTIFINGVAQPTFVMPCNVFSGNFIECRPGNNTALNAAWGSDVLPTGFSARLNYRVRVPSDVAQGTIIQNQARISSQQLNPGPALLTADPNPGNNASTPVNTNVVAVADLGITKMTSNATPVAGGAAFAYTLTVTNNGPSDAKNVVLTDPLPAGILLANNNIAIVQTNAGLSCVGPANGTSGTVTCTSAKMPAGSTATITLVVQADANLAGGVRTNTATITSGTTEVSPDPTANTASAAITITNDARLAITKTAPSTACAGDTLNYDIAVANSGSSSAVNVSVTDTLPANTSFVSVTGANAFANSCSYDPNTNKVTCTAGFVPTGTSHISLALKTSASTPTGSLVNQATLSAAVGTITGSNPASGSTTINHCADLSLTKTAPGSLGAGTTIDYVLKIKNNGPSDIVGGQAAGVITVMDTLPTAVSAFVSATAGPGEAGGFTCTYDSMTRKVTCVNAAGTAGNFPVGAVANITIKVKIDPAATPGTNIQNCAMISAPTTSSTPQIDPNTSNNTSCASSVVSELLTVADLGVSKTATAVVDPDGAGPLSPVALPVVGPNVPAGSVNAGGYIRFDLPFGNVGPANAVNVKLTDVIPGNTAFVGALATGGAFVPASQPPANPFNFTILASKSASPNVSLSCVVSGAAGSQQLTCSPAGNTGLTPSIADGVLPAGYAGTLTFFVKVNESVAGGTIVSNPANITSAPNGATPGTPDPNSGNNTSLPTQTVVVASSNLTISKIVQSGVTVASNPNQTGPIGPATPANGAGMTGTAVIPGTYMTYRVTITNNGPSDVSNIRVTDFLPSGLETPPGRVLGVKYISVSPVVPSGATFICAPPTGVNPQNNPGNNGGSVVCTAPLLTATAPNNTAAIDITVFIDAATKASLINTAVVDATLNNFNRPISGSTTLTTPVQPVSDLTLTKTASPDVVFPSTNTNYTLTVKNLGPSVAAMINVVDTLPSGQSLVEADTSGAPGFTCSGSTTVTCSAASLDVGATAVIKLKVFVSVDTPAGMYTNTATASSMSLDPTPATASAKVTVVVKTTDDPGRPIPVSADVSDQKPGAVLFFPIYSSDAASPNSQNTRINITNISPTMKSCVHLFAVDGATCAVLDAFICLTPNQTASFLASDFDPGNTGYLMAVAVDCATGLPSSFNCLIGDEYVKFSSGHAANLGAESIAAMAVYPVGTNPNVSSVTLKFDGVNYNQLPRILAADGIPSVGDGNSTMLILNRVGGDFSLSGALIGGITGVLFNDQESPFSFTANLSTCQYRAILTNNFPRTFTPFSRAIDAGHTGWMKFWGVDDGRGSEKAMFGSMINFNSQSKASSNAYNHGRNLHKLTLTDKAEIVVPIYLPNC